MGELFRRGAAAIFVGLVGVVTLASSGALAQGEPPAVAPQLDGEHQKFIDLVHFSPEGDRQMAETLFEAIRGRLQAECSLAERNAEGPGGP